MIQLAILFFSHTHLSNALLDDRWGLALKLECVSPLPLTI